VGRDFVKQGSGAVSVPTSEPSAILQIRFAKALLGSLSELSATRGMSVEHYLAQLAETACADHRQKQNSHRYELLGPSESEPTAERSDENVHRLNPQQIQKVIYLRARENLNANALSRRFNCSVSTAARTLANFDAGQHTHLNATGGHNARKKRGKWSISLEGSKEAVAG
jgi:hypothetical protein